METPKISLNELSIGFGNFDIGHCIERPDEFKTIIQQRPFVVRLISNDRSVWRRIHRGYLMRVDRNDVKLPLPFLILLPEYIHSRHVAAIDSAAVDLHRHLVLG